MLYIIIPIVVLLLIFLFAGYVKAPPNKAAIITGLSKNPRVLLGKSGLKYHFLNVLTGWKSGRSTSML